MSKQYDRYMEYCKERQTHEDKELSLKTEYLAAFIWQQTIEYAKTIGLPTTFDLFIDIWTSFYHCIRDMVRIKGIEYKMQESFVNLTCDVFQIQEDERHIFPSILQYQDVLLSDLAKEVPTPRTKEGFKAIYKNLLFLIEVGADVKNVMPDAMHEFEFIMAATSIVEYTASIFSKTSSSIRPPSKVPKQSNLHYSQPSDSAPPEDETDSLDDVLFICFWVIVPIIIIALLL